MVDARRDLHAERADPVAPGRAPGRAAGSTPAGRRPAARRRAGPGRRRRPRRRQRQRRHVGPHQARRRGRAPRRWPAPAAAAPRRGRRRPSPCGRASRSPPTEQHRSSTGPSKRRARCAATVVRRGLLERRTGPPELVARAGAWPARAPAAAPAPGRAARARPERRAPPRRCATRAAGARSSARGAPRRRPGLRATAARGPAPGVSAGLLPLLALGETSRVPDHSGRGAGAAGARQAGGGRRLVDVARLDVPVAAGLGREQPDDAVVGEVGERVDEGVHEVAVVLAPPQQHDVDDLVGVVGEHELGAGAGRDVVEQGLVDGDVARRAVRTHHLHDHAGLDPELLGQATLCRVVRGRAHECPFPPAPAGRVGGSPPDRTRAAQVPSGRGAHGRGPHRSAPPGRRRRPCPMRRAIWLPRAAAAPEILPKSASSIERRGGARVRDRAPVPPPAVRSSGLRAAGARPPPPPSTAATTRPARGLLPPTRYDPPSCSPASARSPATSPLIGCSTAGEIAADGPGDAGVVVMALGGPGFAGRTAAAEIGPGGAARGRRRGRAPRRPTSPTGRTARCSCSATGWPATRRSWCAAPTACSAPRVPLVGGCAGDDLRMSRTTQLHGDRGRSPARWWPPRSAPTPRSASACSHGWRRVGEPMLVTASDGNRVLTARRRARPRRLPAPAGRAAGGLDRPGGLHPLRPHPPARPVSRRRGEHVRFVAEADFDDRSLGCVAHVPRGGLAWFMEGDDDVRPRRHRRRLHGRARAARRPAARWACWPSTASPGAASSRTAGWAARPTG